MSKALARSNKRIIHDYDKITKEGEFVGIRLAPLKEDNVRHWEVYLYNFPNDSLIQKDLIERKSKFGDEYDKIKVNIFFPEKYPYKPLFMHVEYPTFVPKSGTEIEGNIIYDTFTMFDGVPCWEILSPKKWIPTYDVFTLLHQFKVLLAENNVRLNTTNKDSCYSKESAESGYNKILRYHPEWNE